MNSFIHADIFFFISTIAVVVFTLIILAIGFYLIPALRDFRDIARTLKRGVDKAEDTIEDVYDRVEESPVFRFIFGRGKKKLPKK